MPHIQKSALVPYSCQQMYELIDQIEAYPDFIPWCKKAEVVTRNTHEVQATLSLAQAGMEKSFTTRNRLDPYSSIDLNLIDGPFEKLQGHWRFIPEQEGCRVSLDLEFKFASSLMGMLFSSAFNQAANTLVELFIERAKVVYGVL